MIISLFRRERQPDTISTLYGMIVAQARMPVFYREFGVPDTVNGRFDLIVLHLALVLRRLKDGASGTSGDGQRLFDLFCNDMEGNLREMGIADLKVPKEMRHIGEAFYGRAQAYDAALAEPGEGALAEVLRRNILGEMAADAAVRRLAVYVRAAERDLAGQRADAFAVGRLEFPDPGAVGGQEVA